jgi:hypothetical protein
MTLYAETVILELEVSVTQPTRQSQRCQPVRVGVRQPRPFLFC